MDNLIRKIKLESLGYYEFNDYEKSLAKFIKNNLLNLKEVKLLGFIDNIYYFKDDKVIFEFNLEYNCLSLKYDLWMVLDKRHNLYKYEIETILRNIFKKYYKISNIKDMDYGIPRLHIIEKAYKNEYCKKV